MLEISIALNSPIGFTSIASISPLGTDLNASWEAYLSKQHCLKEEMIDGSRTWTAPLTPKGATEIELLRKSNPKYTKLDKSVLYAIYAGRKAVETAGWTAGDNFGINVGSSRGATALFEAYHAEFLKTKSTPTLSSPTTTLGNIASWVGHDLGTKGPTISHSITCSTALHAVLNGIAWIRSGLTEKFLVGGSEAPLTPFTLAQMSALKIYSDSSGPYPCRAMDHNKKENTMVLGEAAAMACVELGINKRTLAVVEGMGYATEPLTHGVSISTSATCFQESMTMALANLPPTEIDVIITHAPGTIKGDNSEKKAIEKIFGHKPPALSCNKWKLGHSFGASGMLSIEMAILMIKNQRFIPVPYLNYDQHPDRIKRVMVNAVGFGGNAVSILLGAVPDKKT